MGHTGHAYQLQYTDTLPGSWNNIGTPVAGNGITINWIVTNGGIGDKRFFRVLVTP